MFCELYHFLSKGAKCTFNDRPKESRIISPSDRPLSADLVVEVLSKLQPGNERWSFGRNGSR